MPLPTFLAICLIMALLLARSASGHPNDSIARDRIPPTPYGERLVRSDIDSESSAQTWIPYVEPILANEGDSQTVPLEQLRAAEALEGAYSVDLVEPLAQLGRAQREAGRYDTAMGYLRRALHLARVNNGLYSHTQLDILREMWAIEMERGDLVAADEIRQYRFRVQQHAYAEDSEAWLAAGSEYSEWQRQLYLAGFGDDTFRRVLRMHRVRTEIIDRMETEGAGALELIDQLYERMEAEYLLADYDGEKQPLVQINISRGPELGPLMSTDLERQEFKMVRNNNFRRGVKTLKKIVDLLETQEPPLVEELARAKIALGDWYLWWDWKSRALESYEQAYALYAADDDPATDPNRLFLEPIELPAEPVFHPALETETDFTPGRALVSFTVSDTGRAREIEILDMEPEESMGARVTLHNMLRKMRFRPVVVNGEATTFNAVKREYHFDY